jgi:hypothetical protein
MTEATAPATKPSKCVHCGKDIVIGKFASHKTAYCEEHASMAPKPTPPKPKAQAPAPAATPVAGGTATAAALASPAPAEKTGPPATPTAPGPAAPPTVVVPPAPKPEPKATPELKSLFTSVVGRELKKDVEALKNNGFQVSAHGVIFHEFPSGKVMTFVELNRKCIGMAVTVGGKTEGFFDLSTIHQLKDDEQAVLKTFASLGL